MTRVIINIRSSTLLGILFKDRINNDNNYYYNDNLFLSLKMTTILLVHPY